MNNGTECGVAWRPHTIAIQHNQRFTRYDGQEFCEIFQQFITLTLKTKFSNKYE